MFAANIVANGSFESGDFSGWTPPSDNLTFVVTGPFASYPNGDFTFSGAEEGSYYAVLGSTDGTLSQVVSDIPGVPYAFSFWLASVGDQGSDFSASWNGTELLSLSNPNTGADWTRFSFIVTGTGSDTILFRFTDEPGYIALDNISADAIPEPASLTLLAGGLIALAFRLRRR
jgi:hypothetical protein